MDHIHDLVEKLVADHVEALIVLLQLLVEVHEIFVGAVELPEQLIVQNLAFLVLAEVENRGVFELELIGFREV